MLFKIKSELGDQKKGNLSFEVISHRFTKRAKESILKVFPKSDLPMDEEERKFKFGQFGYGKYVYPHDLKEEINSFFTTKIENLFSGADIKYII